MSDPIRLIDETSSPALAAVLRSASVDAPAAAHRERELERIAAAAALGVGAGVVVASTSLWLRRTTWLVLGSAIVVTGGGVWWAAMREPPLPHTATPRAVAEEHRALATTAPTSTETAPPVMSVRVDDLPAAHVEATPASAVVSVSEVAPSAGTPGAPDELAMIEAVRSALASGQPSQALERLAAYRRVFPRPSFDVEGDVLEVQALAALGRSDVARQKAQLFLKTHPGSPYAKRIRVAANLGESDSDGDVP